MPNPTEPTVGPYSGPAYEHDRGESSTERLREDAREAAHAAKDEAARLGEDLRGAAAQGAESLKQQAGAQVQQQRFNAAEHIDAVAAALRAGVEALESDGHRDMASWWRTAADGAGRFADRVRDKPLHEAWRDAEDFVREEPTLGFGGAMIAGFMLARFLKSSAPEESWQRQEPARDYERGYAHRTEQEPYRETGLGTAWPGAPAPGAASRPAGSAATDRPHA
jgi:hypothetical protein